MGLIVDGKWLDQWYNTASSKGEFVRQDSRFRHWITPDGSAGSTGQGGFRAESGRYHLYVSLACPWAHRTLIFRALKQLEDHISISIVCPLMLENGWEFTQAGDPLNRHHYLYELYLNADADYQGRATVPVLWDKHRQTIVSNESADIIRMFNSAFDHITGDQQDFYPTPLRSAIDTMNTRIYATINNGVYRAGFATTQQAYEKACGELFDSLDWLESHLASSRYLAGEQLTEADWRLFTTLVRFDPVYHGHFKCNRNKLSEFPNLYNYLRELYQVPGIAGTVDFDHIKRHYYGSHKTINPTGIVPTGPQLDLHAPHNRDSL